uniref:Lipase domain-containing protein n=1 Tax=Romanomermis culicivorax TaxID=13658 RepID=A0A915L3K8_ROMCU
LDPAGPFFDCHPDIGLTKNSAQQVQVLHTDFVGLSRYGTNMDRGHIDYYANKDRGVQPGCPPTTPPVPLVDPFTTFLDQGKYYSDVPEVTIKTGAKDSTVMLHKKM